MDRNDKTVVKNSIGMFDLSRGFLMLAVVMGHSVTLYLKYWEPEYALRWWYPFLIVIKPFVYGIIPMFFIMSGYGFRPKSMLRCIRERIKYLLKPYIITGILVSVFALMLCVIRNGSVKDTLWYRFVPFVLGLCPGETSVRGHMLGSVGPMWFLVVLFIGWIGLNMVFQLQSEGMRALCLTVLMLVCTRLPFKALIPYCLVQSLCCALYMYIGYVIRQKNLLIRKLSKQNLIIMLVMVCLVMPFGNIDVSQNVWQLGSLDFVVSAVAGFLCLKLFGYLNRFTGKIAGAFRKAGRSSLYILCVHSIEYLVFPWEEFSKYFADCKLVGIIVTFVLRSILIAAGCYLIELYIGVMKKRSRR